jgi:hypothetical protein
MNICMKTFMVGVAGALVSASLSAATVVFDNKSKTDLQAIVTECADAKCVQETPVWQGAVGAQGKKYVSSRQSIVRVKIGGPIEVTFEFSGDVRTFTYTGGNSMQVTGGQYREF